MTWAAQGVFALPCGSSGGAELYGISLPAPVGTESDSFAGIPGMLLSVPVAFRRAAAIVVMGSVSNDTGGEVCEFGVSVDSVQQLEVCAVQVPTDDGADAVSLCAQVVLDPGAHDIEALWKSIGSGTLSILANGLRLEVILGQAVP